MKESWGSFKVVRVQIHRSSFVCADCIAFSSTHCAICSISPWTGIEGLVHILPLAETGDGGNVYFFVKLCMAIVFHAVFDGGDSEDKEDREGNTPSGCGTKDCET